MALIVQKFGGTSVGSVERIRNVARRVAKWKAAGHQLVVVPSAMSGETNRLIALAKELQPQPDPRELDVVASTGEQVTIGLLSMALLELGVQGAQLHRLAGEGADRLRLHQVAHHLASTTRTIKQDLNDGHVAIVAGFQGVDAKGNITTLGRGGSDTSAVALAAALKADECQIYTDVDGVYTTDPRLVPEARRLRTITFEEMLEMAGAGSKVLQIRSVEFAGKYKVPTRVLSSLTDPALPVAEEAQLGHADHFRGRPAHGDGKGSHFRRRVQPRRGEDHGARRARPAGHRLRHPRPDRRRAHRRRRDRAERRPRRHDRHDLHRAPQRLRRRR